MDIYEHNADEYTTLWNGDRLHKRGYGYIFDNFSLGVGASGSLITNSKGDVMGVYSLYFRASSLGIATPLRSNGLYDGQKWVYPAYDLILGVDGQTQSYKSQLDMYYSTSKTWLRNKWEKKLRTSYLV